MKLLFDQNLSPKLVKSLEDVFPNSDHVFPLGLDKSDDTEVWEYARDNEFTLVTKDADFGDLSVLRGFPPKVIWIHRGNCKTSDIEAMLLKSFEAITEIETEEQIGLLTLF